MAEEFSWLKYAANYMQNNPLTGHEMLIKSYYGTSKVQIGDRSAAGLYEIIDPGTGTPRTNIFFDDINKVLVNDKGETLKASFKLDNAAAKLLRQDIKSRQVKELGDLTNPAKLARNPEEALLQKGMQKLMPPGVATASDDLIARLESYVPAKLWPMVQKSLKVLSPSAKMNFIYKLFRGLGKAVPWLALLDPVSEGYKTYQRQQSKREIEPIRQQLLQQSQTLTDPTQIANFASALMYGIMASEKEHSPSFMKKYDTDKTPGQNQDARYFMSSRKLFNLSKEAGWGEAIGAPAVGLIGGALGPAGGLAGTAVGAGAGNLIDYGIAEDKYNKLQREFEWPLSQAISEYYRANHAIQEKKRVPGAYGDVSQQYQIVEDSIAKIKAMLPQIISTLTPAGITAAQEAMGKATPESVLPSSSQSKYSPDARLYQQRTPATQLPQKPGTITKPASFILGNPTGQAQQSSLPAGTVIQSDGQTTWARGANLIQVTANGQTGYVDINDTSFAAKKT